VLFSLVGAFYYLRILKTVFFDAPADADSVHTVAVPALLLVNGIAILALGLFPGWLLSLSIGAVKAALSS
jgi:NADH-quinone oxidoreductase subunit N